MEEGRIAQNRQRLDHRTTGAEHLVAFVGNDHARLFALPGVLDDLVGQIVDVDDRLGDAGAAELVEHMVEQWLAGDAHQGFGHLVGEGAHAHAETGGKDHGFGGLDGHQWEGSRIPVAGPYHGDSAGGVVIRP
jgi:hypothetical protein